MDSVVSLPLGLLEESHTLRAEGEAGAGEAVGGQKAGGLIHRAQDLHDVKATCNECKHYIFAARGKVSCSSKARGAYLQHLEGDGTLPDGELLRVE